MKNVDNLRLKFTDYALVPLVFLLVGSLVIFSSIWQGEYNIDPHHWGLMLSNAKDLYEGKAPYEQIFIQYGFLTTLIHAAAYTINKNLQSLIAITSIAYALGLFIIYFIAFDISRNKRVSIYSLITCFLLHPIVIYPWSNYIAFPFLMYAMYLLIKKIKSKRTFLYSGVFFGFAVLSREGLFPAIILIILSAFLVDQIYLRKDLKSHLKSFGILLIGFFVPILIFAIYLLVNGYLLYWFKLSWLLPKIYISDIFPDMAGFGSVLIFIKHVLTLSKNLDFRWILFASIIMTNIALVVSVLFRNGRALFTPSIIKVAAASLLLITSSLHIPEIFRLATGTIIGIITLYVILDQYKNLNTVFFFAVLTLLLTLSASNSGNYFWPNKDVRTGTHYVITPNVFKGQKWKANAISYYQNIDLDLNKINGANCNIKFHHNYTKDAFLQVISPFEPFQLAPFGVTEHMDQLRPDLNYRKKIDGALDIIYFEMIGEKDYPLYKPKKGYFVYSSWKVPAEYFISPESILLIVIPETCKPS